jgi:hypothetical protein
LVKLKSSLRKYYGRHHDLINRYRISITNEHRYIPPVVSNSLVLSSFMTCHQICSYSNMMGVTSGARTAYPSGAPEFAATVTWWVSLMEQELLTLPEHLNSPSVFIGVRVARSLVFCVAFSGSLLILLSFSFGHCAVYLQSLLDKNPIVLYHSLHYGDIWL